MTADTITDEQIRAAHAAGLISFDLLEFATFPAWSATRHDYRRRCAEILNAHAAKEAPSSDQGSTVAVTVGQITVTLREEPARALITCGPAVCDVSPSVGRRFFDELAKINEVLIAAQAMAAASREVIAAHVQSGQAKTPAEIRLTQALATLGFMLQRPAW
jgi:hypothetical protein